LRFVETGVLDLERISFSIEALGGARRICGVGLAVPSWLLFVDILLGGQEISKGFANKSTSVRS
jgi:hypothetical protein